MNDFHHSISDRHYTRGITPKRVATSEGRDSTPRLKASGNTALEKHRSGGEPLATLCPIE